MFIIYILSKIDHHTLYFYTKNQMEMKLLTLLRNNEDVKFKNYILLNNYDLTDSNCYIFRCTCILNKLKLAQWLFNINDKIDVHTHGYEALRYACGDLKNLEMAKWLHLCNNNVDFSYNKSECIRYAFYNQQLNIIEWIFTKGGTIEDLKDEYFHVGKMYSFAHSHNWTEGLKFLENHLPKK